jgi:CubicO group peptidase (beta-lactamase class C family)
MILKPGESAMVTRIETVKRTGKFLRMLFVVVMFSLALVLVARAEGPSDSGSDQVPRSNGPGGAALASQIAKLRTEKGLVGLGAMVMVDGKVVASAVDGERKKGSGVRLEFGDRWHLGSITKSITATMIARLIESGQMKWSDTIGEYFPDAAIDEDWKPVTLRQLLTHTGGAPANFSFLVLLNRPALGPACTKARREAVLNVLAEKPAYPPGKKFAYSNVGYTIAGAMAEQATGATWEDLVKREVFEPLELTGAGFGPPKSPDKTLPQPRGHRQLFNWKVSVDDTTDNTFIMGPAGIVHMSLHDLCAYAREHLRGELGQGKLLSTETYKQLHTPELDNYACGWVKNEPRSENQPTVYWHNGSNTMWYALVAFIPEKNVVIAVASNDGDVKNAEAAAWEVVKAQTPSNPSSPGQRIADYSKKSPFAAVRWHESQPEVRLGDEWYRLVSLDDLPATEIVVFSRETYGNKWQKRFEEDLVELLTRMGHPPKDKVMLVLQSLTTSEKQTRTGVAMTEANRRAIWEAAQARARTKP